MNYKDEIDRLSKQLTDLQEKQNKLERNCIHQWVTKYDPEPYKEAVYDHLEPHGSDPEPIYRYYDATRDRWSRTCKLCGKTEFTYIQAPTKLEPKF